MAIAGFSIQDKLGKVRFFEETFLLADTSMEVVLGMPFLILSDAAIRFAEKELEWRSCNAAEALPTTRRAELIDRREFAAAALNADNETFVVHVTALESMVVHPSWEDSDRNVERLTRLPPPFPSNIPTMLMSFHQRPLQSSQNTLA